MEGDQQPNKDNVFENSFNKFKNFIKKKKHEKVEREDAEMKNEEVKMEDWEYLDTQGNTVQQSIILKNKGNQFLQDNQIDDAIFFYTESLKHNPESPTVYCNRAAAWKKKKEFQKMFDDSVQSIELDDQYFKAYLRNGEACVELGKEVKFQNTQMIENGLKRLQKALIIIEKVK